MALELKDVIVVTDLDGTLLDHHSYSYQPAGEALDKLKSLGIPLIFNSSKTRAEIAALRRELDNPHPFVVENGGGVFVPDENSHDTGPPMQIAFGMPREKIVRACRRLRESKGYRYKGFADMNAGEAAGYTGLSQQQAALVLQRDFTEPLVWEDTSERLEHFRHDLRARRIDLAEGGRFLHLSAGGDKGRAVEWLKRFYRERTGRTPRVIALGDSGHDIPMLTCADYAVLVKSPVKASPAMQHDRLVITEKPGPEGWNEAMLELLDTIAQEGSHG